MTGDHHHHHHHDEARKYIRYDSGVSKVPQNEAEDIEALKKMFNMLIAGDFNKHGHMFPVTHAKTLGVVKGKLVVSNHLPKHLKQSIFSRAGEYPVFLRYSTNSHDVGLDERAYPGRAVSMKIFHIDGERFEEGQGNTTQDFEFNSTLKVAELSDSRTAREIIQFGLDRMKDPKGVEAKIKARPDAALQAAPFMAPNLHAEATSFYSQTPYRFGDYVAKHALIPATKAQEALAGQTVSPEEANPTVVSGWLKDFYNKHQVEYHWKFQLLENIEDQPVEYAGKEWDAEKYPYQTVAKLVFPKQDALNYELKSFYEDHVRSNMWRGLKSLEPLGSTNRVRRAIYPFASQHRERLNGRKVIDIQDIEDLPGPLPAGISGHRRKPLFA